MQLNDTNNYKLLPLKELIRIDKIVTIHYFEFEKNYCFSGEVHEFWEFLYVDKGEVEILAGDKGYKLQHGDIVFHPPNEFHSVKANGITAPNIMVVSFTCNNKSMSYFKNNKILSLSNFQIEILGKLFWEGQNTFETNLNSGYKELVKKENSDMFASEQLIKLYLELFLIDIIRSNTQNENCSRIDNVVKENMENNIVNEIISFMEKNLYNNLTFDLICENFFIGKTHLKTIFKKTTNESVMAYFQQMKISEAKKLIRESHYNFSQIASKLGYESIHYFSRCFKKSTGMTPSEYATSIKSRIRDDTSSEGSKTSKSTIKI
ncbi:AraC-type DNA-binding protein [Clostridium amylolyticum]|uniref:AraC-type DNA-binding protein n=1 Tax=Clostridium amylolyticum TaxID=1121298 RepID=A0A1M6GUJ7_9CLOT|nr:AraC family transcriptional regulator [Clostridium amylolyticum]SHJ13574.1 AraC-type DNA-binding protein [Clostridium amylolyticum]